LAYLQPIGDKVYRNWLPEPSLQVLPIVLLTFFGDYPLTVVAYWIGAVIGSLCVIPAYLFTRRISNDYGGIAAAIIIGLTPVYVSHTYAGFFDTDMFNMILPLLFVWLFVESIKR